MSVITGILFHAVGASCASVCYTPQKKIRGWSWQSFWLAQAVVCWLLLPIIVALMTIPHLSSVLKESPTSAMTKSFVLGMLYGIGGTAFGIAIRYVGFSLTYAIAVGISCVLGTLLPPLVHGELTALFNRTGSGWIISGVTLGAIGIALCGLAGKLKENDLTRVEKPANSFSMTKGLPLCLLAGVLSALYGFSLDQGQPIADIAAQYGAGNFQGNVIYIFSNGGAFFSTASYCFYLHNRYKTFGEYRLLEKGGSLPLNFMYVCITGALWYSQFLFYGLGHTRMGSYKFSSWAIHMIMLVLFSALVGLAMKEWLPSTARTKRILIFALSVLIVAVLTLTYGNYLGDSGN